MLNRIFWRLFDSMGMLGAGMGVVLLATMLGLTTYLVLHETSVASPFRSAERPSAEKLSPPYGIESAAVAGAQMQGPTAGASPSQVALSPTTIPAEDLTPTQEPASPTADPTSMAEAVLAAGEAEATATPPATSIPPVATSEAPAEETAEPTSTPEPVAEATAAPTDVPQPSAVPPALPHSPDGRAQCTLCHTVGGPGVGAPGGTGLPASHQGRGDSSCLTCHSTGDPSPDSTSPAGTATPVPTQPVSGTIPAVPHTTSGRTQCTLCHTVGGPGVGAPGGTGLPSSHEGRTDGVCLSCHTVGAAAGTAATPQAAASTLVQVRAPRIEHSLQGRTDCTACHRLEGTTERSEGEKMPADHVGRTSDMCLLCHQPESREKTRREDDD